MIDLEDMNTLRECFSKMNIWNAALGLVEECLSMNVCCKTTFDLFFAH